MVVVNYKLMINGKVARAEDLYLTSVTAAKRLLSRKIPELWHMVAIGKWEECCWQLDTEICHRGRRDVSAFSFARLRRRTERSDSSSRYR